MTPHIRGSVGRIPPQGGPQSDREATLEREVQSVDITPAGGRDDGNGTAGGGYLRLLPPEHGRTVNCDHTHYGYVSSGRAETKAKDLQLVVGTGRGGCVRDADGGLVGGMD